MKNPTRFVATFFLLAPLSVLTCLAQSTSKPNPSAKTTTTITGRVTVHGQGLSGAFVALWDRSLIEPQSQGTITARTDQDGNYRIANIPVGNYSIAPRSREYVLTENGEPAPPRYVAITSGEAVEGINFEMLRGGVITGTITNSDAKPIIEGLVNLIRIDPQPVEQGSNSIPSGRLVGRTDDRGIYRMYGIPPGRYKVACGWQLIAQATLTGSPAYRRVFYPSTAEEAKAEVIDLAEGAERSNVDINVGAVVKTFTISGRIVDDATGQPIPNLNYGLTGYAGARPAGSISQAGTTNSRGEFKLQNIPAGRYAIVVPPFLVPVGAPAPAFYGDLTPFDVAGENVTDLEIRLHATLDVSGVVAFEGINNLSVLAQMPQLSVRVNSMKIGSPASFRNSAIDSDWTFSVSGLRPGELYFSVGTSLMPFQVKRIERDGVEQTKNIELKAGEHLTGVRLVLVYGTSTVRGLVKFENGTPPRNARVIARLWPPIRTQSRDPVAAAFVDPRGSFLIQHVPAGNYTLIVSSESVVGVKVPVAKQDIVVTEGGTSDVTLTLDFASDPPRRPAP
jgi:protocatechuate 3,4-dioxygenase beta subunit